MANQITQEIHMIRGDWLIEAITAIILNQAHWTPIPTTPTHLTPQTQGRFHWDTQTWWTDAGETTNNPPLQMHVYSPPETRINYPGEHWTITPTWLHTLFNELEANNTLNAVYQHATNNTTNTIAYYNDTHKRVTWGNVPHDLRIAALTASSYMPYNPDLNYLTPK